VTVLFIPMVEEGKAPDTAPANLNREDLTFVVPGRDGRGLAPGKYRIAIEVMSLESTPAARRINQMFSRDSSKIIREVKQDETFELDLSKPEG
jgi:hypothetical protein